MYVCVFEFIFTAFGSAFFPRLLWGTLEPAKKLGSGINSHFFAGFFVGAVFPGFERIFCDNLLII